MPFGCPQATGSAAVGTVCATQTGQATTATAPHALIPACPAMGWCAVATAPACAAAASAPSPAPTETPVRSAPPARMPAPSKSESEQRAGTGHTTLGAGRELGRVISHHGAGSTGGRSSHYLQPGRVGTVVISTT